MIKKFMCENCGKLVNPKTLICDACGTDYNEKPKCEHFYNKYYAYRNIKDCSVILSLKCERCGEVTDLKCSEEMFNTDVFNLR